MDEKKAIQPRPIPEEEQEIVIEEQMESELRDKEFKAHVTKALTLGRLGVLEQVSEIASPQQLAYLSFNDVCGEFMSPLFHVPRRSMLSHMLSKDRQSRKEYEKIASSGGYTDQFGGVYNSGPGLLRKVMEDQQDESEHE